MSKGYLKISVVSHTFGSYFTADFEQYIFAQQRQGRDLLAFEQDTGTTFTLYFGEVAEEMDGARTFADLDVIVSPWKLYLYNDVPFKSVKPGKIFFLPRLSTDFADVVAIDDPVEIVSMDGMRTLGSAKVTGATKMRIGAIHDSAFKHFLARTTGKIDLIRQMQAMYEQPLTLDSVITLLHLQATSYIAAEPAEQQPISVPISAVRYI